MVNRNKAKGTAAESLLVKFFRSKYWQFADRLTLSGANDRGDIRLGDGIPVVIESKNEKAFDLAGYIKELEAEIINAKAETGAVYIKKRGTTDPGKFYVLMTGELHAELLKKAGYF